jgi:hypothetical protein
MLVAKHRSNKGTLDCKGCQRAQVQFVVPQLLNRVEEVEVYDPSPQPRPDEAKGCVPLPKPVAKMASEE